MAGLIHLDLNCPGIQRECDEKNPPQDAKAFDLLQVTKGIRKGNESAFQAFYERYCDRLFRFLLLLTGGNEELARDLLQTTLTKVVHSVKPFSEEQPFWHWLAAIARNTFLDAMRKANRRPKIVPFSATMLEQFGLDVDPDDDSPLLEALEQTLNLLDEDERQLVEAIYFRKASQQSIASERNTTIKAIESKLARTRQKLRQGIVKRLHHEDQ